MKKCKNCLVDLTNLNCYIKSDGNLRSYCKDCHNYKSKLYDRISRKAPHRKERDNEKKRLERRNPKKLSKIILQDSRQSDVKHNRENSLTKEFIEGLISNSCFYCGESHLRMTLDRIDNNIGHIENNIVPACIRCNYARRSMPYQAWMCLVPGMREAREKGMFGNWTGRCR